MDHSNTEPKLAPPGSGLPKPQRWIAPLIVPFISTLTSRPVSKDRYIRATQKILEAVKGLTIAQLNQRTLVPSLPGLEDSSRYWSIGMTIDHLLITGDGFKNIIIELTKGGVPPVEVRIENVKPPAQQHGLELLERFESFAKQVIETLDRDVVSQPGWDSKAKLKHPWFGQLSAHQWYWLMAIHQGIHLKQIRAIRGLLV